MSFAPRRYFIQLGLRCSKCRHILDMTEPILLLSGPQSCTARWPSPFIGNHSTVKTANHRSLYALLRLMWLSGQKKQRPSEKPYSHTSSDCLTRLRFLLTWRFQWGKKERLDWPIVSNAVSQGAYCTVRASCWFLVPVSQCNQTFNKALKGRFYSYVNG